MLEFRRVHRHYVTPQGVLKVLQGVDLHLGAGESLALMGESGSGKSTLLHLAAGLDVPDRGEVLIGGKSLAGRNEAGRARVRRNTLGLVFQQFHLVPSLNVADNLRLQARLAAREEEVREGLWAVPVPAPGIPIRFTYCYLIQAEDGLVVLDPGMDSPQSRDTLARALAQMGATSIQGIVVTHFHLDHWPLAGWLRQQYGGWVALSRAEHSWISRLAPDTLEAESRHRFLSWGVPIAEVEALRPTEDYGDPLDYVPPDVLLDDDDPVPGAPHLRALVTPGHSPGHLCLYDTRRHLLFSGDHVLPRITPYVAQNPYGPANPLQEYLDAVARLREFAGAEVLPAHEYRFTGLLTRLDELEDAVASRRAAVRDVLARSPHASVWTIARSLRWSRRWEDFSPQARRMAVTETAAFRTLLRAEHT